MTLAPSHSPLWPDFKDTHLPAPPGCSVCTAHPGLAPGSKTGPPLPQAANLACLSSLPFWVGGCHGNCKALQAFLVTDQAWKTILESTALYLWEILMKELPDPASVLHRENGRDVRCCCTGRGQQLPERQTIWERLEGRQNNAPAPCYCLIFREKSSLTQLVEWLQHGGGVGGSMSGHANTGGSPRV